MVYERGVGVSGGAYLFRRSMTVRMPSSSLILMRSLRDASSSVRVNTVVGGIETGRQIGNFSLTRLRGSEEHAFSDYPEVKS